MAGSGGGAVDPPPALRNQGTELTVLAQDPQTPGDGDVPLLTTVMVPAGRVLPGPRDHRFFVVDYDPDGTPPTPVALASDDGWRLVDQFAAPTRAEVLGDRAFHAQNVFGVCVDLLNRFESVLGRRIPWGFGAHHLFLVPHGFVGANAGYSPDDHSITFGYLPSAGSTDAVLTCLSHDVIAHELTHAVLDGLRRRYIEPGLPDQLAFHEGFADVVALLSVFARQGIVARLLTEAGASPTHVDTSVFDADSLKTSALFTIGEELGRTLDSTRGGLRQSLADVAPGAGWRGHLEAHRRGEVLAAVVSDIVARIWASRLVDLDRQGTVPLARAAAEGSKVAEQVLGMCIRALDHLPPIEFEFEDFLDAVLTADEVVVPDDSRRYRELVDAAFARYDIRRPVGRRLSSDALVHPWRYQGTNRKSLGSSPDEAYRFLWQNADNLGIDINFYLDVERVLSVTRTGPDGLVVEEIIVDYVQTISAKLDELVPSWRDGVGASGSTEVQCWGGGVVVFDQYGIPRHHVAKPLLDGDRQNRRLRHLAGTRAYDTKRRLGFSYGTSATAQFNLLHGPERGEGW